MQKTSYDIIVVDKSKTNMLENQSFTTVEKTFSGFRQAKTYVYFEKKNPNNASKEYKILGTFHRNKQITTKFVYPLTLPLEFDKIQLQ